MKQDHQQRLHSNSIIGDGGSLGPLPLFHHSHLSLANAQHQWPHADELQIGVQSGAAFGRFGGET